MRAQIATGNAVRAAQTQPSLLRQRAVNATITFARNTNKNDGTVFRHSSSNNNNSRQRSSSNSSSSSSSRIGLRHMPPRLPSGCQHRVRNQKPRFLSSLAINQYLERPMCRHSPQPPNLSLERNVERMVHLGFRGVRDLSLSLSPCQCRPKPPRRRPIWRRSPRQLP